MTFLMGMFMMRPLRHMASLVNTRMMLHTESQADQAGTSTTQDSTSESVKGRPLYPQRSYVEMIKFAEDSNGCKFC